MSSDNWAVALELLLLMIDEYAAPLVESMFERIVGDVRSSPNQFYSLLLVPLRTVGELQNVALGSVASIISTGVNFCAGPRLTDSLGRRFEEEAPHQRVYRALIGLPEKYLAVLAESLQKVALAAKGPLSWHVSQLFARKPTDPAGPKWKRLYPNGIP